MNPHLQRALMLLQQDRHELASEELRQALGQDPDNAMAHAVLGICLTHVDQFNEAKQEAQMAVHLAPDLPFAFYAYSIVLDTCNQAADAKQAIQTAIGMDPYQEEFFSQLAQIEFNQQRWQAALAAAEQGLDLDPEDVSCTNLRAMSLVKLGKHIEAQEAIDTALKRSPEDALSHANMGWSKLEQNQPDAAMEHFREALRLNPEMEWARQGIVEAMKARYFIYRIVLNWFLWTGKLAKQARTGVIFGAYIGYRILGKIANDNPNLAPFIQPLLILYIVFAVMTWMASPLFNLVLRTSRFGRMALSDEQIRTSTWVGICVVFSLASLIAYFAFDSAEFLGVALAFAFIIPPLSLIYSCQEGWPRATLTLYTIGVGVLGLIISVCLMIGIFAGGNLGEACLMVGGFFFMPFIVLALVAQFGSMYLTSVQPRRGTDTGKMVRLIGRIVLSLLIAAALAFVVLAIIGITGQLQEGM